MKKALLVVCIILFSKMCLAQNFMRWQYNDRYFLLGAGTGWTGYFGELNNGKLFTSGLSNVNLHVEARLYKHYSARAQFGYYEISGSDENAADSTFEKQRNLSFFSKNINFSIAGLYHFLPYKRAFHKRRTYEPYALLGVQIDRFNPKTTLGQKDYSLRDFATEGNQYGKYAIVIPMGIGLKAVINEFIDLALDITYHYTFTDYLDDVSDQYTNSPQSSVASALSDRRSEVGTINEEWFTTSKRGNKKGKDTYLTVDLKVQIYLPKGLFSKTKGGQNILSKPSAF